jgi:hypothetical protein
MKKYLPFAIGLIITLGSAAFGQKTTAPPSASPAPSPRPAMSKAQIQKHLIATERKLWDAWKNKDSKPFKATLASDAVVIAEEGVANKETIVKMMGEGGCEIKSFELAEFKLTMINSSTALLTYKGTADGTCGGTAMPPVWCSSVYVNRGGKWYAISHQETPAK